MTYTLKDIKHLEVMANLMNAEPAATQEIDIKSLIGSNEPKELSAAEKIFSLCAKLRNEGFEKQASQLEEKFLTYKIASTHLYKAIDEDGEDLIDAAHPDGENEICDAEGDLGTVETIVTEHEKLMNKITKEPTGKLASYLGQVKVALLKKSQMNDDSLWEEASQKLDIFFEGIKQILKVLKVEDDYIYTYRYKELKKDFASKTLLHGDRMLDKQTFDLNEFLFFLRDEEGPKWYRFDLSGRKNIWENQVVPMMNLLSKQIPDYNKIIDKIFDNYTKKTTQEAESKINNIINPLETEKNNTISRLKQIFNSLASDTKLKQNKKDQASSWIKNQIAEISMVDSMDKLNVLKQEIVEFEHQLSVLRGTNG